ncbi:MAG: GNAT family N-acetyltransferase [Clostridia bacterium]|nr:GNAT family N-acetyltransferase [Clostridia bacterium]
MRVEYYDYLPEAAKQIRVSVFMEEQGFLEEFDELDNLATHLVLFDDTIPVATCRLWQSEHGWHVGRLAVIKCYRGQGVGQIMLQKAEQLVISRGGHSIYLHAQCRAKTFYEKCGYQAFGNIDYDEGVEHVHMVKTPDKKSGY